MLHDRIVHSENVIIQQISHFGTKLTKARRKIIRTFIPSLQTNVRHYSQIDINKDTEKAVRKKNLVLLSYLNVSRVLFEDTRIETFFEKKGPSANIVLCAATMPLYGDEIGANEEIDRIKDLSLYSDDYLVIPLHACSFQTFKTFLENNTVGYIHLAGHGDDQKLVFVDTSKGPRALAQMMSNNHLHFQLVFLNCCKTYLFASPVLLPYADVTICYEFDLDPMTAKDVSEVFYRSLFLGDKVPDAWDSVDISRGTAGYYYLP